MSVRGFLGWMMYTKAVQFTAAAAIILGVAVAAFALHKEDVYFGNYQRYSKPAEVNAKKVFMVIPPYREIVEKNIEKDSALYIIKLGEANKIFSEVLSTYAKDNSFDLICEEGKVEGARNVTDDVVKIIKDREKK
jgi:hypothetical protein